MPKDSQTDNKKSKKQKANGQATMTDDQNNTSNTKKQSAPSSVNK